MKKYTAFIICGLAAFLPAENVFAQGGFTGPQISPVQSGYGFTGPVQTGVMIPLGSFITVNEARNLPHDSWVVLAGNIINMLPGGRQYTFRDSSGDIAVDIGPKEWRGLSVDASERVEIYGEVKIHRGLLHIKVHAITGAGRVNRLPGQPVTVTQPIAVNEARNLPYDSWVVLNGNIINILTTGRHNYTLRDASGGEIIVDIGPKEWRGLSVGASDRVEIYGEIKYSRSGQLHIKVHAIRMIGA